MGPATVRWDLSGDGWLYGLPAWILVYCYFQIPLMVVVFLPALGRLRTQWREAAVSLGASTWQYWREVAFPVDPRSLIRPVVANAFAAYATAAAAGEPGRPIVPC